jgi:hypothetical protein
MALYPPEAKQSEDWSVYPMRNGWAVGAAQERCSFANAFSVIS